MDIAAAWADLTKRASPNVFMNPAALVAANETRFAQVYVLLAWQEDEAPKKLLGVWALQMRKIVPFWPVVLEALPYNYAFLSSPVIDPAFIDEVVPAFLAAIEKSPLLPNVINLPSFNAESPDYDAILKALAARGGEQLGLAESARPFVTREFGVKRSGSTRKSCDKTGTGCPPWDRSISSMRERRRRFAKPSSHSSLWRPAAGRAPREPRCYAMKRMRVLSGD